jgi:hypothetical protein
VEDDPPCILIPPGCAGRDGLALLEHAKLIPNLGHLEDVSVRQARASRPCVAPIGKSCRISKQCPVGNRLWPKVNIFLNVRNAVEVVGIELFGGDEKTTGFLQDSPCRVGIKCAIAFGSVQVEAQVGSQADGAYYGPICGTVLRRMSINDGDRGACLLQPCT